MTRRWGRASGVLIAGAVLLGACTRTPPYRTFVTPEDAVRALTAAVKADNLDEVIAIFGPEGRSLADTSDPATARRHREVFSVAIAERWHLDPTPGGGRVLVVGNEDWPFPVPLVRDQDAWHFDTTAGVEEILARRIGRNELATILVCQAYVTAQHLYAATPHDGAPAGRFARQFASDPGRHNGLYWPVARGEKRSPLGELVARAAEEGRPIGTSAGTARSPFHGYFFKILSPPPDGFALVAWPAHYGTTGVMTFLVNQDGEVRERDLGLSTDRDAGAMTTYAPDSSWAAATTSQAK